MSESRSATRRPRWRRTRRQRFPRARADGVEDAGMELTSPPIVAVVPSRHLGAELVGRAAGEGAHVRVCESLDAALRVPGLRIAIAGEEDVSREVLQGLELAQGPS